MIIRKRWGMKKELHMEKHYVLPLTNEGKFSLDRPPDIPKTMTSPPLHIEGLSLLVTSYNGAPPSIL